MISGSLCDLTTDYEWEYDTDLSGLISLCDALSALKNSIMEKETLPAATPMLDVMQFGAAGDGRVDDAAALQAAIDYSQQHHRALFFPAGTYLISSTLTVRNSKEPLYSSWGSVRLLGEGNLGQQTVITTNTTLTALLAFSGKGPQGAVWECEDCPPLGNTTNGHSIEGIAFVANRLANFSVFGPAVCRSEFLRCSFDGARIAGLYIGWGWINTVSGCWAAGNDLVAMYARPSKAIRRASRRISCITQYPSSEPCEPSQCKYMSCALLSKRD